jgi:hypothetical protein
MIIKNQIDQYLGTEEVDEQDHDVEKHKLQFIWW